MARRIYVESLKKWLIGIGFTGSIGIGLFMYLNFLGVMAVTGYSGDQFCDGTVEDPCYAYLNITFNEDVFIYPFEGHEDPWDRYVEFDGGGVESFKLERSWGSDWREIDLDDTCKGTWCGAPYGEDGAAYSYAFREGRDYQIRLTVYKENPSETVKWTAFGIDPYLLSSSDDLELEYSNNDLKASVKVKETGDIIQSLDLGSHTSINEVNEVSINQIDWDGLVNPSAVAMWYESNSVNGFQNALGEPEFIDQKTGELVEREWRYVVWTNEMYEETTYECDVFTSKNGTQTEECVVNGLIEKTRDIWKPYNSTDLEKGTQRIGIEVEVRFNDYIDGVWDVGGKKIDKHALWTAGDGSVAYWTLDESSGNLIDSHSSINFTAEGSPLYSQPGILNTSVGFDSNDDAFNSTTNTNLVDFGTTQDFSVNLWINFSGCGGTDNCFIFQSHSSAPNYGLNWLEEPTFDNELNFQVATSGGGDRILLEDIGGANLFDNEFHMITLIRNDSGTDLWAYVDNELNASLQGSTTKDASANDFHLSDARVDRYLDGTIDGLGIWNVSLTEEQRDDLWIEGLGCPFGSECVDRIVDLLFPSNNTNFTTTSPLFFTANVTSPSGSVSIQNVSLLIDGAVNEINSSGIEGVYNFTGKTFDTSEQGEITGEWTVEVYNNESTKYTPNVRIFTLIQPIFINITQPLNGSTLDTLSHPINYTYENYTSPESCWWTNNSGQTNNTITCGNNISSTQWAGESSQVDITIYRNSTLEGLFSDEVIFYVVDGGPYVNYGSSTSENDTWLSQDYIYVTLIIEEDQAFQNTTYYLYNTSLFSNSTYTTLSESEENNFTNLSEGDYRFNTTTFNIFNRSNTTETRLIHLDTTFPLISYNPSTDNENTSANFDDKDWFFINVSVTELNEANITFLAQTNGTTYNSTTSTSSQRTINFTNLLSEEMYYFNVTVCDLASNCNTTSLIKYGEEIVNLSMESTFDNISVELGGDVDVNATTTLDTVCLDIDHPDYGVNFTCGEFSANVNLIINYFRKNLFNDSTTSKVLSYVGEEVKTLFFPAHQYDEVDNLSINISGIETTQYPENVAINKSDTNQIDRAFIGLLQGDNIYLNKTITGEEGTILAYPNPSSVNNNFFVDDGATLVSFILNATGLEFGFSFFDKFNENDDPFSNIDTEQTTAHLDKSGFIMAQNDSLAEFIVDDFEDGTIADMWDKGFSWDFCYETGGSVFCESDTGESFDHDQTGDFELDQSETNGYFKSRHFLRDVSNNIAVTSSFGVFRPNFSHMNLVTSESIQLNVSSSFSAETKVVGPDVSQCSGGTLLYLGNNPSPIWQSFFLEDNEWDDDAQADLIFNLSKYNSTHARVQISGIETSSAFYDEACEVVDATYNWTAGYFNISKEACPDTSGTLDNDFFSEVNYGTTYAFELYSYMTGSDKCERNTVETKLYYINNTKYRRTNGTVISDAVFSSATDIPSATLIATGDDTPVNETLFLYLSADDGQTWENVASNVSNAFATPGKEIRWRADFVVDEPYYANRTTFLESVNISTNKDFPNNITFDFGDDGIIDYTHSGELNSTNSPIEVNVSGADISGALNGTPTLYDHLMSIPLVVSSDSIGQVNLSDFNLTYNPNPVKLNATAVQDYLSDSSNDVDFPISVESIGGNITFDDIRYDYAGGNDTIEVIAHNADYSMNTTRFINYFYSRWDYTITPDFVNFLEFIPQTPIAKNVTPFGQNDLVPILNISHLGYGSNADLSLYVNDSLVCVDLFSSINNTKPPAGLYSDLQAHWSFDIDERDISGNNRLSTLAGNTSSISGDYQKDLIAWLKFDAEGDLQDYQGNFQGSSSNLSNIDWTSEGKYSGGYLLNNADVQDKIKFGTEDDFEEGNHTFSIWVKPRDIYNNGYIFDHYNWKIRTMDSTETYRFEVGRMQNESGPTNATGLFFGAGFYPITQDEWTHLVGVYSPDTVNGQGNIKFYANGELGETTDIGFQKIWTGYGDDEVQIGNSDHGAAVPFNGTVDDARIWNRTLSAEEIKALYERRLETQGNAFDFDGDEDYIELEEWGFPFDNTTDYSIFLWANPSVFNGTSSTIDYLFWRNDDNPSIRFQDNGSKVAFLSDGNNGGINSYSVNPEDFLNQWSMIGLTYDYTTGNLTGFVNGQSVVTSLEPLTTVDEGPTNQTRIGWDEVAGREWTGQIDEIRIYNKSLSLGEVQNLYNRTRLKYYDSHLIDEWNYIYSDRPYLYETNQWMWADYSCSYDDWTLFNPFFFYRQCAVGSICSEDIT